MAFGFTSIGHAFATVARDIAKGFQFVEKEAPIVEPIVEGVTAVLDPAAVVTERAAFNVLGTVLGELQQAGSDAKAAVAAKGLIVTFDQATVADLRQVLSSCESVLVSLGVIKKTPLAAAQATLAS